MKEAIKAGLGKIVRIEHLETPEEAKQQRIDYLDYLESRLNIPSHIRDGYLNDRKVLGGAFPATNWDWKTDWEHKDEQLNIFNTIYDSGLDGGLVQNKCYIYHEIPTDKDMILFNKIRIVLRRKKNFFPAQENHMAPGIPYTLERAERDIQQPDSLLH